MTPGPFDNFTTTATMSEIEVDQALLHARIVMARLYFNHPILIRYSRYAARVERLNRWVANVIAVGFGAEPLLATLIVVPSRERRVGGGFGSPDHLERVWWL